MTRPTAWFNRRGDIPQPDWALALCAGAPVDLWFPERGQDTRDAKEICRECPIQDGCLEYAVEAQEKFGVWGGKSERERRRMRRTRRTAA